MLEQKEQKSSMNEVFLQNYFAFIDSMNQADCLIKKENFYKTILKTKYLIPTSTQKSSSNRIFEEGVELDFIPLKNKDGQIILPLFTTKTEIKQLEDSVFYMIVNYFEAHYLAKENNLNIVINPFSINYFVDEEVELLRRKIEGVIAPEIEILVKQYRKTKLNQYYLKILELLHKEELYMPLCLDENNEYTLSYKEKENKFYLCVYVSERFMYKKIPEFHSYETVNLRNILKVVEIMDFSGILIQGDILIELSALQKLQPK